MMKLFKTFLLILITLFLIYFLSMNNAKVDIDLLFKKFDEVSISMVIFGFLSLGVLFGYTIAVFSVLSSKAQNRNLQNKIKNHENSTIWRLSKPLRKIADIVKGVIW